MIVGLDHVQLAMPPGGEDAARAFYGELLGMTEVPKPDALAARGGIWFEAPGTALHLGTEEPFTPARKAHPALLAARLEDVAEALTAAGVRCDRDRTVEGVRRLYADDPFGNRLEIIQAGDGFRERSPVAREK